MATRKVGEPLDPGTGSRCSARRGERVLGGRFVRGARNVGNWGLRRPRGRSGGSRAEKREVGVLGMQERERGSPSTKEGCVKAHQGREEMGLGG